MDKRPIPSFYCVYLLRSIPNPKRVLPYVGSTPHPPRRLRQHNGESIGGAERTRRDKSRPWEMTLLVTGFPSKIAALQFEWAWQHPHLTRHLALQQRSQHLTADANRRRNLPSQRRPSLVQKLISLHHLLQADSFGRWPIELHFLAPDVFQLWQKTAEQFPPSARANLKICVESGNKIDPTERFTSEHESQKTENTRQLETFDLAYSSLRDHLRKSLQVLKSDRAVECAICNAHVSSEAQQLLTCAANDCTMVAHLTCLAAHFLQVESQQHLMLPVDGNCPKCSSRLLWSALVRELSLRIRAPDKVKKLIKEPKSCTTKTTASSRGTDAEDAITECQSDCATQSEGESDSDKESWNAISSVTFEQCEEDALPARKIAVDGVSQGVGTSLNHGDPDSLRMGPSARVVANSDFDDIDEVLS